MWLSLILSDGFLKTIFSIYMELAEQYALMDAASNVPKRNVLAQHLREVIDCLERKVCCLKFKPKKRF
jgi:hypothetical protein